MKPVHRAIKIVIWCYIAIAVLNTLFSMFLATFRIDLSSSSMLATYAQSQTALFFFSLPGLLYFLFVLIRERRQSKSAPPSA